MLPAAEIKRDAAAGWAIALGSFQEEPNPNRLLRAGVDALVNSSARLAVQAVSETLQLEESPFSFPAPLQPIF